MHYLEDEVRSGAVKDYAELARFPGVIRRRTTQILDLLLRPEWRFLKEYAAGGWG